MRLDLWSWRPWDQTRAVVNARTARTDLSRARVEREDADLFVAQCLARRGTIRSA